MVEPIMYLAIGFLVSMLCGLMVMPLVHNRAVRLTTKRLEAATPLSMAEIQADKDQLRAEFAMSARRLEMSVEQLKSRTTSQLAELGKKSDAINRLKHELGEKNATIFSLEAREKAVKEQLRATEEEFAVKTQALRTAEAALAEKQSELGKLSGDLSERSTLADTRQAELLAVRAQIEALQTRVSDAEQEFGESRTRLEEHRAQSSAASAELIGARDRVETLSGRVGDLDRQLMLQVKEAELLGNRVADLEGRLATQGKILAERDYENNLLKQQFDAAKEAERVLRAEIASLSSSAGVDKILAEKAAIETQLRAARDERAAAQRELNAMQSQAEASWATERMENALLRERINDIAAEVAKLASQLEGPDSPIDAILASDAATARLAPASESGGMEATGTLAERIRALQSHASRARQAN